MWLAHRHTPSAPHHGTDRGAAGHGERPTANRIMNVPPLAAYLPVTGCTDRIALRYPLPPQSAVVVVAGAVVAAGDVLAHATRPPILVPVVAGLSAARPDNVLATTPPVGTPVRAGDRIGSL